MKTLFKIWISLVLIIIMGFLIWFPTGNQIKGCMTTSMFHVELCPKSKDYVPLNQISKNIQNAIILTEDASFYQHSGFDEEGIQHCYEKMKEKKRIVCGGSTITQQLAKNMFLTRHKNFLRKGVEALITFKIEDTLTKREILEKYLNIVQFGTDIYGVKQASQFYFKKQPSQISVTEAAFLAMLLPNPEKYSQSFFKKNLTKFARKRIGRIVKTMYRFGRIDAATYENAIGSIDYFLKGGSALAHMQEYKEKLAAEAELNEDLLTDAEFKNELSKEEELLLEDSVGVDEIEEVEIENTKNVGN